MADKILGAGLAGCIVAFMNRHTQIFEAGPNQAGGHRAVLRFRTATVGEITGIPFRKVFVHKGIWSEGHARLPDPALCNQYSKKVIGEYQPRSIWNIDMVERYVAPPYFHELMVDSLSDRIQFDSPVEKIAEGYMRIGGDKHKRESGSRIISTIPMNVMAKIVGAKIDARFNFKPIHTRRATIANCNIHQTIYFPDPWLGLYRASLVGDQLILEGMRALDSDDVFEALSAFGIALTEAEWEESSTSQRYGKIAPISEADRRNFILQITLKLGVFSVGRFATWRNILLDDVVDDVNKIQRMSDQYQIMKEVL